jgi:DNA-binding winged helix-turn-helix (wHTH) protein
VHATKVAASGFYQEHHFVVTERPLAEYPEACVVIPDGNYQMIPSYWERISQIPLQLPIEVPKELRGELVTALAQKMVINEDVLALCKAKFARIQYEFWEMVEGIMPEEIRVISEVEVRLTQWGTVSSYRFLEREIGQKLIVYLRNDVDISHLAEAILTAILYPFREEVGVSWSKREAIVDFLLTRKRSKKLFPRYLPTLGNLSRLSQEVRDGSFAYCRQLGIPRASNEIEGIKQKMSRYEGEVLQLLGEHRGEIVSFDMIADRLWGEGEFRSLWAINKLMQRVRAKLVGMGYRSSCLTTRRGRGYILRLDN